MAASWIGPHPRQRRPRERASPQTRILNNSGKSPSVLIGSPLWFILPTSSSSSFIVITKIGRWCTGNHGVHARHLLFQFQGQPAKGFPPHIFRWTKWHNEIGCPNLLHDLVCTGKVTL